MGKPWDASVTVLQGVGSVREKALERMGIRTLGDLLMTFPRGYCDVAGGGGLAGAQPGALTAALVRAVSSPVTLRPRPGLTLVRCDVQGDGRRAQCLWYNQPWIAQQLHAGEDYLAIGRADFQQGTLRLLSPDLEPWQGQDFPPVLPLYPLTRGLSQRIFRSLTAQALRRVVGSLPDPLPAAFRRTYGLCERNYALEHAHYPATLETCRAARERLALEEMLLYMLALGDARARRAQEGLAPALPASEGLLEALRQGLGFPLTGAQERVLGEVLSDMAGTRPMNRMVQGDVGSGKTAVALMALAVAAGNGRQGALMAPTEILAVQLYQGACQLLEPLGFRVGLLTGSMKAGEKRQARAAIAQGEWDVAVGTHALIQGDVAFHDLALVVTDEQHRFGVRQRKALSGKASAPHTLVMSATPVPRSLALVLYGDLELSVVDELPPGRKPVITKLVPPSRRAAMLDYIAREAAQGRQTYIVCPAIDPGEGPPLRSASALYRELTAGPLRDTPTALVHGRMSAAAKDEALEAFRRGEVRVLVSTTVIEVGINVPQATIMVIEDADRFGLAQLHQLRGRVGRSSLTSYCFLLCGDVGEAARERLGVLTASHDGFVVAEKDLALRGPGEFLGTRQAGALDPRLMALLQDPALLERVRAMADAVWAPELPASQRDPLLEAARKRYAALYQDVILN